MREKIPGTQRISQPSQEEKNVALLSWLRFAENLTSRDTMTSSGVTTPCGLTNASEGDPWRVPVDAGTKEEAALAFRFQERMS